MIGWIDLTAEETTKAYNYKSTPPRSSKYFASARKYIPEIIKTINDKLKYLNTSQKVMLFQIIETNSTPEDSPGTWFYFDFEVRAYEGFLVNPSETEEPEPDDSGEDGSEADDPSGITVDDLEVIGVSHPMRIAVDCKSGKGLCGVIDPINAKKAPYINSQSRVNIAPKLSITRTEMSNSAKPIIQGTVFQTAAMEVSVLATESSLFVYTGMNNGNKVDIISFIRCIDALAFKKLLGDPRSSYTWLSNGWLDSGTEIVKGDKALKVKLHSDSQKSKDVAMLYEMLLQNAKTKAVRAYIPDLFETDQQRTLHGCEVTYNYINFTTALRQEDAIYLFVCLSIFGLKTKVLAVYPKQEEKEKRAEETT